MMNKFIFSILYFFILSILLSVFVIGQNNDSTTVEADSLLADSTLVIEKVLPVKIGDIADGNKSVPVHLVNLYDENGYSIHSDDKYFLPFSTKNTCGDCHTYDIIKNGTHFSIDKVDSSNRVGEPFIYTNHRSLTLLPLSYKKWAGTIIPDSVDITPFKFLKLFGSHLTGGNISENEDVEALDNSLRWQVSGKLEINCMVCHDADPEYDQAEFAKQIRNENFRWATSAATSMADVKGYANKMPDNFDPYTSSTFIDVDLRTTPQPSIKYDLSRFDENNKVFLDIKKDDNSERCLFCHSTSLNDNSEKYLSDQADVHLAKGMSCVDCHKNNISHDIVKGYAEEHLDKNNKQLHSFSCEGCHINSESGITGSYGAPKPLHTGIPIIHFEKLSCTVCHSSYLLDEKAKLIKTSQSHKLGVPGANKVASTFPLIQSPVFVKANNGKIEPRNLVWPSYWAEKTGDEVSILNVELVEENIQPLLNLDTVYNFGPWPTLEDSLLISILDSLNNGKNDNSKIVFISGGMLHELSDDYNLISEKFKDAEPFTWPIAHNVRPAQQSLGINGCDDCHSVNSNFYFGDVEIISSVNNSSDKFINMTSFQGLNPVYQSVFSLSFYFRPMLKYILLIATLVISLVVISYLFSGMKSITAFLEMNSESKN